MAGKPEHQPVVQPHLVLAPALGTEHLLLALVQADVAPVAALLAERGVTYAGIRAEVAEELSRRAG